MRKLNRKDLRWVAALVLLCFVFGALLGLLAGTLGGVELCVEGFERIAGHVRTGPVTVTQFNESFLAEQAVAQLKEQGVILPAAEWNTLTEE